MGMVNGKEKRNIGDGRGWGQFMAESESSGANRRTSRLDLDLTAEEMDKMEEQSKKTFPTTKILMIPREEVLKVIWCVRCEQIPHPDDVMCCDQGHYTCGPCCVDTEIGKEPETEDPPPTDNLNSCCADLRKLNKMESDFLKGILTNCQFKCRNYENGCEMIMTGDLMKKHYEHCKLTESVKCRFQGCTSKYAYLEDLLEHYQRDHQATILEGVDNSILLPPINFKQTMAQRLCAILKIEGLFYVFGCELVSSHVFIWLWSLEHPSNGVTGLKTDTWYNLRLKRPKGKIHGAMEQSLGYFEGRCLVHCVDPEVICKVNGGIVESFKMEVTLFKKLYVDEKMFGGEGGWILGVLVKEGRKVRRGSE